MSALQDAITAIDRLETVHDLSGPLVRALPVSGASISTFGGLLAAETLSASDASARRIDEIQFDLQEGPCWDALASGLPVLEPDINGRPRRTWPAFSAAIREVPIGGLLAYPLIFGSLRLGAIDLYTDLPVEWSPTADADAASLSTAVARSVLRDALDGLETQQEAGPHSRRLVNQATGMVVAQLRMAPGDAELLIRGHAFATSQTMRDVAQQLIDRALEFRRGPNGIEATA